jgi:hypothetical protein
VLACMDSRASFKASCATIVRMARPKSAADYARWFASQGGKARRLALTPEERSAIAKKAADARWRSASREERRAAARKAVRARWAKKRSAKKS